MARITLINPKSADMDWGAGRLPRSMEEAQLRHSLTQISAVLKRAGHDVRLLDLRVLSGWEEFEARVLEQEPDFACVTAHTCEAETALECVARLKALLPRTVTVAGGIHFTMFPTEALGGGVDFVIRGEGEISLPELIQQPHANSQVLWGTPPELDSLPFEDRKLYPDYRRRIHFPVWDLPTPIVDLLTGRGCPWQCRFCCGPGEQNLFTRPSEHRPEERRPFLRRRSVDHVMAELAELHGDCRLGGIIFHDDQFLIQQEWTEEFCRRMVTVGYPRSGVRWWAACRSDMICRFPEQVRRMKSAGLKIISIGFESFSDPLLQWMQKGSSAATHMQAAEICRDIGIDLYANVMFGLPRSDGEWRWEDDLATFEALDKINPKYFSPSYFSPIPGSWFFEWAQQKGLMTGSEGRRNPDGNRIRGVDYARIGQLLVLYQRRFAHPRYDRLRRYGYRARMLLERLTRGTASR